MKTTVLVCASLLVVSIAAAPSAGTSIYQFDSSFGSTLFFVGGQSSSSGVEADAIGGILDRRFEFVSGAGYVRSDVSRVLSQDSTAIGVALNRLVFDADSATDATTVTPNGLGGLDITDAGASNAFLVDVFFSDMPASLSFTVHSNSGADVATGVLDVTPQLLGPLTATTLSLPFSSFSGPVNFANVGAIVVEITGDAGSDILLDNLRTGVAVVNPAPPAPPIVPPHAPLPAGVRIIDAFNAFGASSGDSDGTASFSASNFAPSAQVLGGFVAIEIDGGAVADPGSVSAQSNFGSNSSGFDDTLFMASDATLGQYDVVVGYDGDNLFAFDPAGLGSVDLTDGGVNDALRLGVLFNDVPVEIEFKVFSAAGAQTSTATLNLPGLLPGGGSLLLPFSTFAGNADFTDISALQFSFVSGFGQDLRIDYLAAVPEPTTASLALLLLSGLVVRGRSAVNG